MPLPPRWRSTIVALFLASCTAGQAANVVWDGSQSSAWEVGANWDNGTGPVAGDVAYINSGDVEFSTGENPNLRALRLNGGTLTLSGGTFKSTFQSSWDSHVEGTVYHTGAEAQINELEVGRTAGDDGFYYLSGGSLRINRGLNGHSLYLGGNKSNVNAGNGTLEISGGSMITRTGVKLGDDALSGTGRFAVLGSAATEIGIARSTGDQDGTWMQHAGSTLQIGIDPGGVTPIFIADSPDNDTGTLATFQSGALLDVDYHNGGLGGGTWTVLEVENGDVVDNGLAFAPGVDTSVWSLNVDNTGANGLLQVTAIGEPQGIPLIVGGTEKQRMRYGLDYERLWYWTNSMNASEKDMVAQWSVVDCDVDFIRVAINSKYELTEGTYDRSAYTSKIWPMMRDMQDANPNIKFFASPRPLNEAVSGVAWQPYPQWITGSTGNNDNFNFNWQKCAEYLVRYVELMKSEGFQISYMDMTNEWNFVTPTHVRDIVEYMKDELDPADMPLVIAPSAWSYAQGRSWLSGVNTNRRRNAIDIAACHNTDKTGTAEAFAERSHDILGTEKEVWNTELHGWKSTSGEDEVLTSSFMFEAINAGFSGLSGWLAIGTTNQGHCYILNPNGNPTRNVKYFIFKKLTNTSHTGHALDINQPSQFKTTSALIRDNVMTVWVINDSATSHPVRIFPSGRQISDSPIKRTRWSTSLSVEGVSDDISATDSSSVWSTISGNSLYCFEIQLDPDGVEFTRIEAEAHDAKSGTQTETTTDADGVLNVGYISDGDWCRYDNITLGPESAIIRMRVAARDGQPDGKVEVRLGSPSGQLIGTLDVPQTGGWQNWVTIEGILNPVPGEHSLYLSFVEVGTSVGSSMFNINWFALPLSDEPVVPDSPTGLAAVAVDASHIELTWSAVAGADDYTIKRSTSAGGPYTTVASGIGAPTYTDPGLTAGTRYYYVSHAAIGDVESDPSNEATAVPSAPITASELELSALTSGSDNGTPTLYFTLPKSELGHTYRLQGSSGLSDWQNIGGEAIGTGNAFTIQLPLVDGESRWFYRIVVTRQ